MKLSLNQESVTALREFSDMMPQVIGNLEADIAKLVNIYNSVAEDIGSHEENFGEMLLSIQRVETRVAESINELTYMLKSTADKMESYIQHGSSYGVVTLGNQNIQSRYSCAALNRLNSSGTNQVVKELYDEFFASIRIIDYDFMGTPFYNSLSNGIKLNAMADLHNSTGTMSTYFHEVGHMLDDLAGNGHLWLSADPTFGTCLREDIDTYITQTMISKHCEMMEAYDIISEEISGDWNANISDIFGSLTNCRCQGDWGHHYTYWQADPTRIEKEAFANMFEASIGDEKKLQEIKKFFPKSYARFEYIIRSR